MEFGQKKENLLENFEEFACHFREFFRLYETVLLKYVIR